MAEYAATGLPPAYLALDDSDDGIPADAAAHAAVASAPSLESMEEPS
jgi:hypothetical protein